MSFYTDPLCAAAAIGVNIKWFLDKTTQQKGLALSPRGLRATAIEGAKAGATIGLIVGFQIEAEKIIRSQLAMEEGPYKNILSSSIVGVLSVPGLAIFQGGLSGISPLAALRALTLKQLVLVSSRESGFILVASQTEKVAEYAKNTFGQNWLIENCLIFGAGMVGSVVTHPADTIFSRMQSNLRTHFSQVMLGVFRRSIGTGGFVLCYHLFKQWTH